MQLRCSLLAAVAAAALSACVIGSPPGFSDGDRWEIPLLGADEGGELFIPVYFKNEGPYLFMLDPSTSWSSIDARLVNQLGLHARRFSSLVVRHRDADDRAQGPVAWAEVPSITLGDLTVRTRKFDVIAQSPWSFRGAPVLGILGQDIIDDTLIWQIDRDRSVLVLATQGNAEAPSDAMMIKGKVRNNGLYLPVSVDGKMLNMVTNFRNGFSRIWPEAAEERGFQRTREARLGYTDEWGKRRELTAGWRAPNLSINNHDLGSTVLFPIIEKRVSRSSVDGSIGQDVLAHFNITVNWHKRRMWLQPRASYKEYIAARLARWGGQFAACETPACITIERSADGEQPKLEVVRSDAAKHLQYDVLLQGVDPNGDRLALPRLLVAFPAGVTRMPLAADMVSRFQEAAEVRVVDCSPYPLPCDDGKCVWLVP